MLMRTALDFTIMQPTVYNWAATLGPRGFESRIQLGSQRYMFESRIPVAFGRSRSGDEGISGPWVSFQVAYTNWWMDGDGAKVDNPNPITIVKNAFESAVTGQTMPVTFETGDAGVQMIGGKLMLLSDSLPASAFDLPHFTGDLIGYVRVSALATPSGFVPIGPISVNSTNQAAFYVYAPADDLDEIYGSGPLTKPFNALSSEDYAAIGVSGQPNNQGFGPVALIGKTLDGTVVVKLLIGPSTFSGNADKRLVGQPAPLQIGWGGPDRGSQAADLSATDVTATLHMTRYGAQYRYLSANEGVKAFYQYANEIDMWPGNNGIDVYTARLERGYVYDVISLAARAGIEKKTIYLGWMRNTSGGAGNPDKFTNYLTLNYISPTEPMGRGDYWNRMIGQMGQEGRVDVVVAAPWIRSDYDGFKYATNGTDYWMTPDGFHPSEYACSKLGDDQRWLTTTGLRISPRASSFVAGCRVYPTSELRRRVSRWLRLQKIIGSMPMQLWLFNAPFEGDAGRQTRLVNICNPGVWDAYPIYGNSGFTYGANGIKGNGATDSNFRFYFTPADGFSAGIAPEISNVLPNYITLACGVLDVSDRLPAFAAQSGSSSDRTLFINPYNSANRLSARMSDNSTYEAADPNQTGIKIVTRVETRRRGCSEGELLAFDTQPYQAFTDAGVRLFGSTSPGPCTTREYEFMMMGCGMTDQQMVDSTDNLRGLLGR